MPHNDVLTYGSYIGMALQLLIVLLFLGALFVVRPRELDQFSFQKRLRLSVVSMQGEQHFFSKIGLKKLKTYRRLLIAVFFLLVLRLGVELVFVAME